MKIRKRATMVERKRRTICKKAAEVYVPNGLLDSIPKEWGCNWEELIKSKLENSP